MVKYIILGIVQGLTEFLPVSSSAHLVIMEKVLGISGQEIALPIVLHLGTLLALVLFFFKDICETLSDLKTLALILIVTVITGVIGITGKDFFEGLFSSVRLTALALIVTGVILIFTLKCYRVGRSTLNFKDALLLGLTQAIAIIPGISRSGITISTLLFRKIDRNTAFRFSFLASMPAIFGAALLEARKINFSLKTESANFAVGFIFSFAAGLFGLWALKKVLNKAKLHYFGYYCIIIAVITLVFIR